MMSKNILCVLLVAVLNFGLSFRTLTVKKSPFVSEKMSSLEMTSKNRNDAQSLFRKFCLTGLATVVSGLSFENQSPSVFVSSPMHMNVAAAEAAVIPAVGADAPAFTLPSNSGKDLSLDDFPGKRIVLYFYPVRTNFCLFLIIYLQQLYVLIFLVRVISHKDALSKRKDFNATYLNIMNLALK